MSRSITYTFPASNQTDVCKSQTLAAAGNLVLNGNLANQTNSAVNFTDYGYARSVVIASETTRNFTINGIQNGVSISETFQVVINTQQESNNIYDTITSITVDGAAANVTVGSGYLGAFKLVGINLERDVINYSLSIHKLTVASIPTAVHGTLANIANNGLRFVDIASDSLFEIKANGPNDQYIFPVKDSGISQQPLYKFILITISGTGGTANNSIQLNFIQT